MSVVNGLGGPAGFGENSLNRNDDGSSSYIDLSSAFSTGLNFFGTTYTGLYLNNNGSVTFEETLGAYTPTTISSDTVPGIFPYWADVDTRGGEVTPSAGGVSQGTNLVYYDVDNAAGTFIATWDDVGYYSSNTDLVNTFQIVITDLSDVEGFDPGDFSIAFNYEDIQWTTGDASDGVNGLGGTPARIGYSSGSGTGQFFELPSSGDQDALLELGNAPGVRFVSDGSGVVLPPDAKDDAFQVAERRTVTGNLLSDNGSGSDEDLDNDVLVVASINGSAANVGTTITLASGAELLVATNGDITFTASLTDDLALGDTAEDIFTYTVSDGRASGQATVTVSVNGINASPVALDDSFQTDENTQLTVSASDLLSNDTDPDGDLVAAVSSVVSAQNGTAVLSGGSVVFTPDAGFVGNASFVYEITDTTGLTDTATASVTVNEVAFDGDFEVVLPDSLSPGQSGQAQINYTGEADTSAPKTGDALLFAVSTDGGLVADPLSAGFSDTAFVLANTTADGAFEAIDISVKGTAGPRSSLGASVQLADMDAETEIAARVTALQPNFLEADVAARIEANLVTQFGATVSTLTTSLAAHADSLASLGLNADSATAALAFAIEAAGDYGSLQERGKDGSLGQGWSSLADIGLDIEGTTVQMRGLADLGALRALSVDASALYTVSNSAVRSVSLSGDALALAAPVRPQFEQSIDGSFQTTSAFAGTFSATDTGFSILTDDGETLVFDADGNFLQAQLADGQLITAAHDGDMQITGLTGPNGASLVFARNADGTVQSVEDADGITATFGYNADGFLETVTRPEGQSSFAYNSEGDLTSATAPGAIQAQFAYDAFGRLASADYGAGAQTETFAYDDAGGLTITDGAGRTTELDLLPGSVVGRITDGVGSASEIIYNENGAIAGVRAPDGTETLFQFDDEGRLTQITDANGAVLGFTYDAEGEDPTSFTDAGGGTRSFDYDAGGRITEATWPDGTSLEFSYDDQGNLTGYSNRRGDDVTYTYDARGRLLSESDSSAGPTTYTYDARGRLTSATNDQGTTSLTYDSADRVTQIDYPTGKSLFYTYNDAGLRASMSDGEDYNVFYDYDALGRLTGLRDEDSQIVAYEYDGAGNLVREENGNGTVSLFTYDAAGRLTRIENQAPDASINSFNAYTYDAAGQRIANETQDGTWTYGYDAIGQLTSAEFVSINPEIDDKSLIYEYDAAGNRTRVVEDGVETLYTANALNQYTQVGDETFTYDADGNMTSRSGPDGTTTYTYDLDNRLTSVTEADGTVLEFDYDVFGNRVAKTVDGVETEYLVDPFGLGDVVSEFTGESLSATYAHGLGLAAGEIGGVDAFYDADAVGTVTTLTGTGGAVQNSYVFTPFGSEVAESEGLANDFEFNGVLGVMRDTEDLLFMRARNVSESIGRFLSEDANWGTGDPGNLYRFAGNVPTITADPTGLELISEEWSYPGYFQDEPTDPEPYSENTSFEDLRRKAVNREPVYDAEETKILAGIAAREAGEIAFSVAIGSKVKAGKGVAAGIEAALDTYLNINETQTKQKEIQDLLDSMRENEDEDTPLPQPDEDSPVGPPIPKRKPVPPVQDDDEEFTPPIPQRKPTDIGSPAGDGRSDGDPHLVTFDGTGYSFQAVGEFTLAIGDGFEIQTRQTAINDSVSVNSATVMNIGDNVVGIYAEENIPLVINGTAVVLAQGESIAVGDGSVYRGNFGRGDELGNFDVYVVTDGQGNGFWTNVYFGANHLRPFVASDDVAGLLGNLNGDRSDDFQLRDGTVLPQPLAQTVLYGAFADSWRITQEDSLFVYADGESTETFTDRNFPTNIVTLDDLDPDARAAAEAVAIANGLTPGTFEFETTVLDVVLTGSEDFAVGVGGAPEFQAEGEEVEIVEVQINEAPTAVQDTASVDEDGSIDIDVLANDTDPEGDTLTLAGGTDPNGGTVAVVDGELRFAPAANFNGETTLTYDLTDAGGNTVTGRVVVTVTAQPDAPVANDDGGEDFTTDENIALTTASVLLNDSDADGDTLRIAGISLAGTLGLITDNGDGTFGYDPNGAFDRLGDGETATDTFSYTLSDGNGGTSVATVTLTITGVSDDATGSDEGETVVGSDAAEELDAMGGDDIVDSGGGADRVTLGAGADALVGDPASIFGDTITDFSEEDRIIFEGVAFGRSDVTVGGDPVVISVDTDEDGTVDGSLTVLGDFSSGDFMAVALEGDTTITFETFLPALQERQAVDPDLVNGIINQAFLTGDGTSDFQVTLRDLGFAGYDNVVGVYEIDQGGNIVDTRILFENANADKSAVAGVTDVEAGNRLGFFIGQDAADWAATLADSDVLSFVNDAGEAASLSDGSAISIAVNGAAVDEMVFHSFSEDMNSDGVQHALSGVDVGGEAITVGFEDLTGGGDRDYEDVVFRVEIVDDFVFV